MPASRLPAVASPLVSDECVAPADCDGVAPASCRCSAASPKACLSSPAIGGPGRAGDEENLSPLTKGGLRGVRTCDQSPARKQGVSPDQSPAREQGVATLDDSPLSTFARSLPALGALGRMGDERVAPSNSDGVAPANSRCAPDQSPVRELGITALDDSPLSPFARSSPAIGGPERVGDEDDMSPLAKGDSGGSADARIPPSPPGFSHIPI